MNKPKVVIDLIYLMTSILCGIITGLILALFSIPDVIIYGSISIVTLFVDKYLIVSSTSKEEI